MNYSQIYMRFMLAHWPKQRDLGAGVCSIPIQISVEKKWDTKLKSSSLHQNSRTTTSTQAEARVFQSFVIWLLNLLLVQSLSASYYRFCRRARVSERATRLTTYAHAYVAGIISAPVCAGYLRLCRHNRCVLSAHVIRDAYYVFINSVTPTWQ